MFLLFLLLLTVTQGANLGPANLVSSGSQFKETQDESASSPLHSRDLKKEMNGYSAKELSGTTVEYKSLKPQCGVRNQKLVHFVRHAEGHHNVAGEKDWEQYKSEKFEDALLSELGHKQCSDLAKVQQSFCELEGRVELVVTSVLRRCLQTASLSFPTLIGKVPWIATELCREQTGQHPCDRRVNLSESKGGFQHVDFTEIVSEADPLYYKWNNGEREPTEAAEKRCEEFMEWLFNREETEIIVCTHSAILAHMIPLLTGEGSDRKYANAELRSYLISKS